MKTAVLLIILLCLPFTANAYFVSYDFGPGPAHHYDWTHYDLLPDGEIFKSTYDDWGDYMPLVWRVYPGPSDRTSGQIEVVLSHHFSYSVKISQLNILAPIGFIYQAPLVTIPPSQILIVNIGESYSSPYWVPWTDSIYPDLTGSINLIDPNHSGYVDFNADQFSWSDIAILTPVPEPSTLVLLFLAALFASSSSILSKRTGNFRKM
jgi:hypothetical protein